MPDAEHEAALRDALAAAYADRDKFWRARALAALAPHLSPTGHDAENLIRQRESERRVICGCGLGYDPARFFDCFRERAG